MPHALGSPAGPPARPRAWRGWARSAFALPALLFPACVGDGAARPVAADLACTVERVVDGDTFRCVGGERVRLLLIDAPEMDQGAWGARAREEAERLLPPGSSVRLELDVQPRDRFDRLLAYVWTDSVMVNRALVQQGMAVVLVYPPNVKYVDALRADADRARRERTGLWGEDAFACAPVDHRAGRC